MAAGHYMLSGDFFENYKKYDGFFEMLENPDSFRRYKMLVIDRADLNVPCSGMTELAFDEMLASHAERRKGISDEHANDRR